MKIACVGKWWSGKSSISRLMTQYLLDIWNSVCAVDSDHNMDFTDLLGYEFDATSPNFKDLYDELFIYLKEQETTKARAVINKYLGFHKFFLEPKDNYTQQVLIDLSDKLKLAIVWLGADDVMWWSRCAHGMSNPLKVRLTLLDEGTTKVVVDGVAGVDMINFGLYHACDFLLCVVEPSRNSIKVANQIANLCDMSDVNYGFIVNKYVDNEFSGLLYEHFGPKILTTIGFDDGIFGYDYTRVATEHKDRIADCYEAISTYQWFSLIERVRKLESLKR
jgi:CO dehydrogenase nickel-insertion accessory protein CooC1